MSFVSFLGVGTKGGGGGGGSRGGHGPQLSSYRGVSKHIQWLDASLGPRPFLIVTCEKGGGEERKGSGETADRM